MSTRAKAWKALAKRERKSRRHYQRSVSILRMAVGRMLRDIDAGEDPIEVIRREGPRGLVLPPSPYYRLPVYAGALAGIRGGDPEP